MINLKFKKIFYITFGLLIISTSFCLAGTSTDPSQTIYLGRTLGMGGAYVALSQDGEGLFSNPAGLAEIQFPKISGVARKIFLDETQYSILSSVFPTIYGTIGFGYVDANVSGSYATSRDSNNRIILNPSIEVMSYDNNVFLLSYSKTLPKTLSFLTNPLYLGGNLKIFNQSISGGNSADRGLALDIDLGASYNINQWLKVGSVLQNVLGSSISWKNSSDKMGGFYKFGCSAAILGTTNEALYNIIGQKLITNLDFNLPHDLSFSNPLISLGFEWTPIDFIYLRCGINQQPSLTSFTTGIGFEKDGFRFDYAYAAQSDISGDSPHYFSLSYVGTMVETASKTFKRKEKAIKFTKPSDRTITSQESIPIAVEAKYATISEQKTIWTVPVFSTTSEIKEVKELNNLAQVYIDNQLTNKTGLIKMNSRPMPYGRYVIKVTGLITPEGLLVTDEVKVLHFDPFLDTPMNYWAIEPIAINSELGLLKGYPDKTFKPQKGITRAELTSLLVRTLGITPEVLNKESASHLFSDVLSNNWAASYINMGVKLGLVQGYPNNTFKPKRILTRSEAVSIIARYAELATKEGIAFSDLNTGFWANKYIIAAKEAGLLKYIKGSTFEAFSDFSRAEAAEVLYRTKKIQKMTDDFWAYGTTLETGKIPEWMLPATSESVTTIGIKSDTAKIKP